MHPPRWCGCETVRNPDPIGQDFPDFFFAAVFLGAFFGTALAEGRLPADFAADFFAVFFLGLWAGAESSEAGCLLRALRVFAARAAVSSASNSAGLSGRADLRSRSIS